MHQLFVLLTLTGALPRQNHSPVDSDLGAKVNPPQWLVHVVVIENGTIRQVGVQLAVDGQGRVAVPPLGPCVPLVVHPRLLSVGLVGNWKKSIPS